MYDQETVRIACRIGPVNKRRQGMVGKWWPKELQKFGLATKRREITTGSDSAPIRTTSDDGEDRARDNITFDNPMVEEE